MFLVQPAVRIQNSKQHKLIKKHFIPRISSKNLFPTVQLLLLKVLVDHNSWLTGTMRFTKCEESNGYRNGEACIHDP